MMASLFDHYPEKPNKPVCEFAFLILCNAHDTSSSLLDIFNTTRHSRSARGTPTDEEQDLLRAMLAFAGAGLDSMIKQLVNDALPAVIDRQDGAAESFRSFIEKRINRGDELDHRLVSEVLCDRSPRDRLVRTLTEELTAGSLQSTEAVLRTGSFFDIPSNNICADPAGLTKVFRSRNQMIHEMDVDFSQPNRNRRPRRKQAMVEGTNLIFLVARNFLREVVVRLK
jgi:hypothetical protein